MTSPPSSTGSPSSAEAVLDALPDPVLVADVTGRLTFANRASRVLLLLEGGVPALPVMLWLPERLGVAPAMARRCASELSRLLHGEVARFELTLEGRLRGEPAGLSLLGVEHGAGAERGALLYLRDLTQELAARRALESKLDLLQVLMDAIPSPIFYKDAQAVYQGCNRAFEAYIGIPRDKVIGSTVYDVAPRDLADRYQEMDLALMRDRGVQSYESSVRYADGERHDVIFHKATFAHGDGSVAGLIGVMLDITDRKRVERELRATFEVLAQRDAAIQHDLEQARSFQERTLPEPPRLSALDVECVYQPADQVGGDFYDLEADADGTLRLCLVDATGHGVQAALTTMLIKAEYETIKRLSASPGDRLRLLNERLARRYAQLQMRFTALCAEVSPARRSVRYASAAHPAPVVYQQGTLREGETGGTFLGLLPGVTYPEWQLPFLPGDGMFFYTDGVVEQFSSEGDTFGEQKLIDALAVALARGLAPGAHVAQTLRAFVGEGRPLADDYTLLAIRSPLPRPGPP